MTGQVYRLCALKSREVLPLFGIAPPFWLRLHLTEKIGCWPYQSFHAVLGWMHDEAVQVAVGIRLDLNLCEPHTCQCGALVDAHGLHGFVCKSAPGIELPEALNDIIYRAFSSVGFPATKEPVGLTHFDGKRPDGLTLVPLCAGKSLTWDVTAVSTLAD